ncbi:hypothetical protein PM082_000342 [Marasmius tenuissimus]|nr:hypothetical protein PM082_000342 [Marasmius tenuissimus]
MVKIRHILVPIPGLNRAQTVASMFQISGKVVSVTWVGGPGLSAQVLVDSHGHCLKEPEELGLAWALAMAMAF